MSDPREFGVILKPAEEGGYTVSVPDLPGCHTEGETLEESLEMARDAIEGYLQVLADEGLPLPKPARFERVKVGAWAGGCRPFAHANWSGFSRRRGGDLLG
jgi:antitoxin HicB